VHQHHPDLPPAHSQWSENQTLHIAAAYSNPFRWRTRRELANDFRRHMMQLPNVELHLIEIAYGDRPHDVANPTLYPNDIALRTTSELFHKENLLNLAVARFPQGWQYGAIIDADFHFTRHDIGLETIHQLQHYDWVQMFSAYSFLNGEAQPGEGHRPIGQTQDGFAYTFVKNGRQTPGWEGGWGEPSLVPASSGHGPLLTAMHEPSPSTRWIGAPGGAWAFRRSAFDAVGGILDRCILGSADFFMAFGLAGQTQSSEKEKAFANGKKIHLYHNDYTHYIRAWQERATKAFAGNVGYVDCFAVHHFHGPISKRGYSTRDDILIQHEYSPLHDVYPDWQGVLQLGPHKPRLRDDVRNYFLSRSEDLP
jgi:hypothetical protein